MTALSSIRAGGRLTAAQVQGVAPYAVIKGADESVTSSTSLQDDDALFLALPANSQWLFKAFILYEGGTLGSSDLKCYWSMVSGASLDYHAQYLSTGGTAQIGVGHTGPDVLSAGTAGAGTRRAISIQGTLLVGSEAGNVQFVWAQNTSSATPTIVHAQSSLELWAITQ